MERNRATSLDNVRKKEYNEDRKKRVIGEL